MHPAAPKEPSWTGSPPRCPRCRRPRGRCCSGSSPACAPRSRWPCWPSSPSRAASTRARGELVADKLPITPRRTTSGPFLQRLATGATIGAAVHYDAGRPRPLGALLGTAGAGAGAWAGTRARVFVAERTSLPAPLIGAVEDLLAVALAYAVVTAGRDAG